MNYQSISIAKLRDNVLMSDLDRKMKEFKLAVQVKRL